MLLSIDLSGDEIRILQCDTNGKKIAVKQYAEFDFPEAGINGGILNQAIMQRALTGFITQGKFTAKKAVITVNSSAVVVKELTIPQVKASEIRGIITNNVKQFTNAKQDYIVDYIIIGTVFQENANFYRVLAFLIPKAIVEMYKTLLLSCGLVPYSMDVLTHAIFKLVRADNVYGDYKTIIFAGLNKSALDLYIIEDRDKIIYRNVPVEEKASMMESEFVLSVSSPSMAVSEADNKYRYMDVTAENISKMVQFQLIKNKENPVQKVFLCSGKADDEVLSARISEAVRIPSQAVEKPQFLQCTEDFPFYKFAAAVGAVIGS